MIYRQHVGWRSGQDIVQVEAGALRFFAEAIGETGPVHIDLDAARRAGYPGLVAPLTYAFSLNLRRPDPRRMLRALGIEMTRILHGSQSFQYSGLIFSGDAIGLETEITDVFEKRGGALIFLVHETIATNQTGSVVTQMTNTTIVQRERDTNG